MTTNYLVDLEEYLLLEHPEEWKKDITSSYMASTYQLLMKQDEALRLINEFSFETGQNDFVDDFHSDLSMQAQHIFLLARHFEPQARKLNADVTLHLTDQLFKGNYNTISAAYSILALGALSQLNLDQDYHEVISFAYQNAKNIVQPLVSETTPFHKADYPATAEKIIIKAEKPLYYLNIQSGFDSSSPTQAVNNGIEIRRDFLDVAGNKVTTFEQGKELLVRVRVRALTERLLTNVAVVDLLPGGFEVIRSSVSRSSNNWSADYIDVREDRVVYYGDFDSSIREFTYRVKLTAVGEFVIPPSYAASMYDRSIRSVSESGKFIVIPSK